MSGKIDAKTACPVCDRSGDLALDGTAVRCAACGFVLDARDENDTLIALAAMIERRARILDLRKLANQLDLF